MRFGKYAFTNEDLNESLLIGSALNRLMVRLTAPPVPFAGYTGTVAQLFESLCRDPLFFSNPRRPHAVDAFRASLKRLAPMIHGRCKIVVTLAGAKVTIQKAMSDNDKLIQEFLQ